MIIPFSLWVAFIGLGVLGSIATFVGILITFSKERQDKELW